jgi:hypothetical protein
MSTDGIQVERLARVEQDVLTIKEYMMRMDGKLDAWNNTFVPRQEINEMFRSRDKEIQELKDSKKSAAAMWVGWAGVAVAVIAIVVTLIK